MIVTVFIIFFVRGFVGEPGKINGPSMESTFVDSQIFLVNKFILLFTPPNRGDIVQILHDDGPKRELVVKRIIGLPGEIVEIKRNQVFITDSTDNTYALSEPYLAQGELTLTPDHIPQKYAKLAPGQYFLLGDNRDHSIDSRYWGPIDRSWIVGKVHALSFSF